jgi:hypothetical protein
MSSTIIAVGIILFEADNMAFLDKASLTHQSLSLTTIPMIMSEFFRNSHILLYR